MRLTPKQLKRKNYREVNSERLGAQRRGAYHALEPWEKSVRRWMQLVRPPVPRKGSKRSEDPRKRALARACVAWSDADEMLRTYIACAVMTELTGVQFSVDHTVPLSNPLVCGLHSHTNLRVISKKENAAKSNWIWPQMPEISWKSLEMLGFEH